MKKPKLSAVQVRVLEALENPEESNGLVPGLRLSTLDRLELLGFIQTFSTDKGNAFRITAAGREYLDANP